MKLAAFARHCLGGHERQAGSPINFRAMGEKQPQRVILGMTLETANPLKKIERIARRSARIPTAVAAVLFAILFFIGTILTPPRSDELLRYLATIAILFGLLAAFWALMDRLAARAIRRLSPLKPHVREAALPWPRGPTFVLDNGLLLTYHGSGVFLTMFFGPDGSVRHVRLEDALRWTKRRDLKLVSQIRGKRGPPAARAHLDGLQARLGGNASFAAIGELKGATQDMGAPRWVVSAIVLRLLSRAPRPDRLASELSAVESFFTDFFRAMDIPTSG